MKTKINLLIFFLALTTTLLQSQTTPKFQWVKGGGSQGVASNSSLKESCKWMGTDAHGNIYGMSSLFNMNIQIDTSFRPYGFGYDDFAVFSYRCDGSMRWVRYFGSFPNDIPVGMFIDNMGNSYIAGHVSICDLGDAYLGDSIIPQTFTKSKSAFVAKLDSNGHTLWVNYPGPDMPVVPAIATLLHSQPDNQGNLCVLAMFSGAATGGWTSRNNPLDAYASIYSSILQLNLFIENVDLVKWSSTSLTKDSLYKVRLKGEAYGLRAYYGYLMLRNVGGKNTSGELLGYPIVTVSQLGFEDSKLPRNKYADCVKQIIDDCDMAAKLLPLRWTDTGLV